MIVVSKGERLVLRGDTAHDDLVRLVDGVVGDARPDEHVFKRSVPAAASEDREVRLVRSVALVVVEVGADEVRDLARVEVNDLVESVYCNKRE